MFRERSAFRDTPCGVLVTANISHLPESDTDIHGFHIHSGSGCEDDFKNTSGHFNPENAPHPQHAGDMPPLFSSRGKAYSQFLTNRFKVCDIVGRTVIIHSSPDDFTSQPSGNSGEKIACGVIKRSENFS